MRSVVQPAAGAADDHAVGRSLKIRRRRTAAAAAAVATLLGGCGGGGGGGATEAPAAPAAATEAPAAPAAAVDPSSDNVITGPVNQAREAAEAQEAHDRAIDGAVGGQP